MRSTFINTLMSSADKDTFLLIGDLGYSVVEPFVGKYPNQFLNVGVAEQNMTGMAAGLALEGYKVFTYSIANFNTIRCLEQIRNDICYHNLDVTVVSVGGGLAYGSAGYSHHAVQDIAMLGSLPNMTLLLPGDPLEVEYCMEYIFNHKGPKYLRIGKNGEKNYHKNKEEIKDINLLNPDIKSKVALVSVSTMLPTIFELRDKLLVSNIDVNIFSCPIITCDFKGEISKTLQDFDFIFTVEEHISDFGFGSLVKNTFEEDKRIVKSYGLNKNMCKLTGSQKFLCDNHALSSDKIVSDILRILEKQKKEL